LKTEIAFFNVAARANCTHAVPDGTFENSLFVLPQWCVDQISHYTSIQNAIL
jgi:hypothetical protein